MITTLILSAIIIVAILIGIFLLARKAGNTQSTPVTAGKKEALTQEQTQSLSDARSKLTAIRMTLSRIQNRAVSKSGNDACASIEKVLATLKEKPEKIMTSRQLFNYYLPTIEKVVSKYQRIEAGNVMDDDMPAKVERYLSNVNEAMGNLYEGLYDNDKLHVDVDMEAMTIAIKRDGLLDDEDFVVSPDEVSEVIPDIREPLQQSHISYAMPKAAAAAAPDRDDTSPSATAEGSPAPTKAFAPETEASVPPTYDGPARLTDDKTYVSAQEGIFADQKKESEITLTLHPGQDE